MLNTKKNWNTKFNSKDTTLTDISSPWWWNSRSAETCRRACIYCVDISVHIGLINWRNGLWIACISFIMATRLK